MLAGRMKYMLELLEPKTLCSDFGDQVTEYIFFRTVHAERVKISGSRVDEVGEHFADYRVEYNIRDVHPVKEGWHARQLGGYEYIITNVIPNRDRGMLTLICERLNP